ncbi:MAG TPA: hypothetical protein VGE07_11370 [Herpetosiphonaceae bacterium]
MSEQHESAAGRAMIAALLAAAPDFGPWLTGQGIPRARWSRVLEEPWAAQFYAVRIAAGTAGELAAFLLIIDTAVTRLRRGYGYQFATNVMQALFAAGIRPPYLGDALPPTLKRTLDEWYADDFYDSRHDTWSYGVGGTLPPERSGY